jgi:hypothetical protein
MTTQRPKYSYDGKTFTNIVTGTTIPETEPVWVLSSIFPWASSALMFYYSLCVDSTHRNAVMECVKKFNVSTISSDFLFRAKDTHSLAVLKFVKSVIDSEDLDLNTSINKKIVEFEEFQTNNPKLVGEPTTESTSEIKIHARVLSGDEKAAIFLINEHAKTLLNFLQELHDTPEGSGKLEIDRRWLSESILDIRKGVMCAVKSLTK